ncbi:hypothetical protein RvY_15133 [Ramazzottius varieornatus]|uniref:Delta-like protein n=1 Tax=Ramazzottius varieornatus TaxID=947166 RepID=A0A1D1VXB9_RAMVA|nr:hypothetical protein RvY_15133 [Ramazzottius varieornatus]
MDLTSVLLLVSLPAFILQMSVEASGVFELRLERFEPDHLTADRTGGCCRNQAGLCTDECTVYFRICLKHYQTDITSDGPCTFGEFQTPVLTGSDSLDTFANMQRIPFNFTWPETISVIIEAWHQPPPTTNANPFDLDNPLGDVIMFHDDQLLAQSTAHRTIRSDSNRTESVFVVNSTRLTYSYRVICDHKYYGPGCSDLCRPRDDGFGHYTCTANGTRICREGWTGPYCTEPVCAAGCNAQRGYCEVPHECRCRTGWQGKDCSECIRYPGCQKGTCQLPWQCNCLEGWGGLFCDQDLNYCTHHRPCVNGGTCTNTGLGSYTCDCPKGFTGANCEVRKDQCEVERCKNGGVCRATGPGNFTCDCPEGFSGKHCDLRSKTCSDNPCKNEGLCRQHATKGYGCLCKAGFEGKHCELDRDDCRTSPCKNGGTCHDLLNSFSCTCPAGYSGATCQHKTSTEDCSLSPCLNGGTCSPPHNGPTTTSTCTCAKGYEGGLCQTPSFRTCADSPCRQGASCENTGHGDFLCHCPQGFAGKLCDVTDTPSASLNLIEDPASAERLRSEADSKSSSSTIFAAVTGTACTLIVLLLLAAMFCFLQKRHNQKKQTNKSQLTTQQTLNFNMNNFQQKTSPPGHAVQIAKPWKPTMVQTCQNDNGEDLYSNYTALPKRINSCYGTPSNYGNTLSKGFENYSHPPSHNLNRNASDIYMKVMTNPTSHYQTPRRSHSTVASPSHYHPAPPPYSDHYPEFELAENVQQEFIY